MAPTKWISRLAASALLFSWPMLGAAAFQGEYGYLTAFHCQSDAEARGRIRTMALDFGIQEFQLYDWFADYSTSTRGIRWTDPFFHKREICRQTLRAYVDEIHRQGGRAWAYVQAVGAEETTWADPAKEIFPLMPNGQWYRHAGRFPCYFLNAAWAEHMVRHWAPTVREMGFDGIHWDTLGALAPDHMAETGSVHAFLKTTQKALEAIGLNQTMKLVDMAWWDPDAAMNRVGFPYVEVWSIAKQQAYFQAMSQPPLPQRRGVLAFYPSAFPPPGWPTANINSARHRDAVRRRMAYIAVADGARRVVNEYWPNTVPISPAERKVLAWSSGSGSMASAADTQSGAKPAGMRHKKKRQH
jgi:hypothetical protein